MLDENHDKKRILVAAMGNNIPEGDRTIHEYIFSEGYENDCITNHPLMPCVATILPMIMALFLFIT